jgi:hypothetical protein
LTPGRNTGSVGRFKTWPERTRFRANGQLSPFGPRFWAMCCPGASSLCIMRMALVCPPGLGGPRRDGRITGQCRRGGEGGGQPRPQASSFPCRRLKAHTVAEALPLAIRLASSTERQRREDLLPTRASSGGARNASSSSRQRSLRCTRWTGLRPSVARARMKSVNHVCIFQRIYYDKISTIFGSFHLYHQRKTSRSMFIFQLFQFF